MTGVVLAASLRRLVEIRYLTYGLLDGSILITILYGGFIKPIGQAMRKLRKNTLTTATEVKLIDLAIQAVDGSKIPANAALDRNYDVAKLDRLRERTGGYILYLM